MLWHREGSKGSLGDCQEGRGWLRLETGVYQDARLPSSTGGPCDGEKKEKDPGGQGHVHTGQVSG